MKRLFFLTALLVFITLNGLPVLAGVEDDILPERSVEIKTGQTRQRLPTANLKTEITPKVIKIALALAGSISFGVFVYAGIMLVISQGNEEEITKFKNILIWSIVGLLVITTSYAIVRGVLQLVFK